ncbi:protein polybromo-1 isoform X4 [Chironomus tepperi]|uniref:protein polybromo-1 isoform X4 n=1 Tax=Chironomus tepperi TaxID=113505 RepID=UPI00391F6D17
MMSKRRRTSSEIDSDSDDDSGLYPNNTPAVRKRKKLDPMEQCQSLYDSIRNHKKDDGTQLCDSFIRAPKRRQEPNYYEIVTNPIDLLRVQQKLKTDSYEDIDDLTTDIELLVNNAKAFYKPDSSEYKDACALWEVYNSNKSKLIDSMNEESTPTSVADPLKPRRIGRPRKSVLDDDQVSENSSENNDYDIYEELFAAIMTATDPADDRSLHTMFQLLPSKKHYPDYYAVIDHPIDLKFIANKIQTNAYTSLNDMEKDVLQMVKNAQIFNEPGSQIYKDAKTLKKVFIQRKADIDSGKYKRPPTRQRGRPISYSAACAALKEELDSSEEEMDEMDDETQTGPLWQLFDNLYNQSSSDGSLGGSPLGESLWKLPNKRFHPEYYTIIKKPLSMSMVQKKLKKNEYANVTELSTDLYLMIDNAKKANLPSSKIYKDAVKMQKILNQKLVDDGLDDDDTEDTEDSQQFSSIQGSVDKKKKGRPRIHPVSSSTSPAPTPTPQASKFYKFPNNPTLKKKLMAIHKHLLEYSFDGRQPAEPFLEKPSKKLYPDYYTIIQHPIDMNCIHKNIENDRYGTVDDIVGDYRLMFNNCRKYNEENSMIYDDANMLERVLNDRLKELSGIGDRKPKMMKMQSKKAQMILDAKLKKLYETIKDYKDPKTNRQVATIFMKLPSKMEYPDYYEIISKPIDLEKIGNKLRMQQYDSVDELSTDLMLMFENACKYNEPDSQIYKDALMLQQVCIQTKTELRMEDENVPDVPQVLLDLLMQLFTTVYNYQDEEGRCYSDSMAELPEQDEIEGGKQRAISLDLIKRRLDKGIYKRLDIFQEDMFACFERARRLSRTDSQVFEDSIEMQSYFIKKRDELCKNGEVLSSPALSYTAMHLSAAVEAVRQTKLLQEEEPEAESSNIDIVAPAQSESMSIDNGKIFTPGDFVYYSLTDDQTPGIMYIERLFTDQSGEKLCHGNVYLRPYQTYHLTTRKFLEQEVFKSDQHQTIPLKELQQKCYIMSVKDYFKMKPESFADKDVYVCEFRYNSRARSFKKIKAWPFQTNNTKLILREEPLEPKRVQSVFKDRPVDPLKLDIPIDEVDLALTEKEKCNVEVIVQGNDDAMNTYYEQFNTACSGTVKTGDYVYVATESGKQAIAQINSIWETKEGKSFFRGPWILTPTELPPMVLANHLQFRQEVFLSTVQETTPTIGIVGKCCVLEVDEYTTRRPTEIPESDVFLCESIYDEFNKQIKKLQGTGHLKKFTHTQAVTPDEIYYFRRPIVIQRDQLKMEAIGGGNSCDFGMTEDSMDTDIGSDGFALNTSSPIPTTVLSTPASTSKRPAAFTGGKSGKKVITGYILYSSEVRKAKVLENPECKFGDISRMIGDEWRALPQNERRQWEDRASAINEQNASKYAEEMALNGGRETGKDSPIANSSMALTPNQLSMQHEFVQNQVFECCWDKCDYQFEDPGDALEHTITDSNGCVQRHFQQLAAQNEPIVYHCLWRNCIRARRNQPPLPNIQRLMKHVREVHVVKAPGKIVQPQDRGKNYVASTRRHLHQNSQPIQQQVHQQIVYHPHQPVQTTPVATGSPQTNVVAHHQPPVQQNIINYVTTPVEPLFVTVPPRPQRVLHSEAYIKYIEGLQNNNAYVGQWEKSVKATRETINTDVNRLPTHWLGARGREKPEEVIDALWKLRNFMWKDAFTLSRNGY